MKSLDGEIWTVRADVIDCRELELVLPARKEAVENAFLQKLRNKTRLAIYRALVFDDAALHVALKHVASADEAIRTAIAQVVQREIQQLIPRDRHADITISGDPIDITLGGPLKAETRVRFP